MTDSSSSVINRAKKIFVYTVSIIALLILSLILGIVIYSRFSDGPLGPIQGGAFRTGELVSGQNVDWNGSLGGIDGAEIEFQLDSTQRSRTTGSIIHNGQLYIPCDLGFMWKRFSGGTRLLLQTMYTLKSWHEAAMQDGNAVIRIGHQLYERRLVRVTDPELLSELRSTTERQVDSSYMGPLPDVPGDPEEIWYFRVDPRI